MNRSAVATVLSIVLLVAGTAGAEMPASAPSPAGPGKTAAVSNDEVVRRMLQTERTLVSYLQRYYRPTVEIYIQNLETLAGQGLVPTSDAYAVGRFTWNKGPRLMGLRATAEPVRFTGTAKNNGFTLLPDGFVAMTAVDWKPMDTRRYRFTFVRREFLGEARCYVVDATLQGPKDAGFTGRLWIEDRGFNIVRFQGINSDVGTSVLHERISFHVDSWRTNVMGGIWLPSIAYVEEIAPKGLVAPGPHYKGQIRMWGYDAGRASSTDEFTAIRINDPTVSNEAADRQPSPVESRRQWEQEAETNVLDRLDQTALLAAPGPVDRVLETVVNNLLVTNDVALDRPVRVRVLLTSPFESFTVGHTIVVSRGLVDVLPDEASLAMVLASELSHIVLGHHVNDTYFAFPNRLSISDDELLRRLTALLDPADEAKADVKALELLQHSPYKDKLAGPSLFLNFITANKRRFASLIQPRAGDAGAGSERLLRLSGLLKDAPALAPEQLDQIPALALGARLTLDPWSRRLELQPMPEVPLISAREKTPLAVSPVALYLKYHVQMPGEPPVVAAIGVRNQEGTH